MTEIHIRNMVCDRCIRSVEAIFKKEGIFPEAVGLGFVKIKEEPSSEKEKKLRSLVEEEGFEWLDDQKTKLIKEIKGLIIELVHYGELDEMNLKLSGYLSEKLNKDYHYLSNLFSSVESTTIEQYFILQKIEKVKEWLVYNEYTLSEIAFKLGYSSVAHLSGQFKKVTGLTPTQFRDLKEPNRKPLDRI